MDMRNNMYKFFFLLSGLFLQTLSANCLNMANDLEQGRCYVNEGNTNLAQAAYERILSDDPQNKEAHIKLSALYQSMQMPQQANAVLADVKRVELTPAQRASLDTFQRGENESLNAFKARASLSLGYDTNVNISPNDTIIRDLNATTTDTELSTLFTRARADLTYLYDIFGSGGFFLRSDATLYFQNNTDAAHYNISYGRLYLGGGYRTGELTFYLPMFYDRLHYLGVDLLEESGLRPDLTYSLTHTLFANLNASYTKRHYFQSVDAHRDDEILTGGLGLFWLENRNFIYFKTRYENYTGSKEPIANFTNKVLLYAMVGGIYALDNVADFSLDYQYRNANFSKVQSISRKDDNHNVKVAMEREIIYDLRLNASYRYITNNSSYDLAKYDKQEMMLGLVYNY